MRSEATSGLHSPAANPYARNHRPSRARLALVARQRIAEAVAEVQARRVAAAFAVVAVGLPRDLRLRCGDRFNLNVRISSINSSNLRLRIGSLPAYQRTTRGFKISMPPKCAQILLLPVRSDSASQLRVPASELRSGPRCQRSFRQPRLRRRKVHPSVPWRSGRRSSTARSLA